MDGAVGGRIRSEEDVVGDPRIRNSSHSAAHLSSRVLGAKWGESHRWDGLSDPGIRLCRLPTLVPFSSTNLHPGTGLLPPLARNLGWQGQGLGLRSELGPGRARPEPGSQSQSQG